MNDILSVKVFIQSIKSVSSKTWLTEWKPEKFDLHFPCKHVSFVWLGKLSSPGDDNGYNKIDNLIPPGTWTLGKSAAWFVSTNSRVLLNLCVSLIRSFSDDLPFLCGRPDTTMYASPIVSTLYTSYFWIRQSKRRYKALSMVTICMGELTADSSVKPTISLK